MSVCKVRAMIHLHTEGTVLHAKGAAQVSEWFNISDAAKTLYYGKINSGIPAVITTKLQTGTQS